MGSNKTLTLDVLKLDCNRELERIEAGIRHCAFAKLKKRGAVVALSGGVDSSVVASLCVRALGKARVFGLLLPEMESSPETLRLSRLFAKHLGISVEERDITDILTTVGCYKYRDNAIRTVISEYRPDSKCKIVFPSPLDGDKLRIFSVVVESPEGKQTKARLSANASLQIVAASNF